MYDNPPAAIALAGGKYSFRRHSKVLFRNKITRRNDKGNSETF